MAHRFGHTVSRYDRSGFRGRQMLDFTDAREEIFRVMSSILNDGYGKKLPDTERKWNYGNNDDKTLVAFYQAIGTMRSARMGKIRNEFEFTLELLAQYMLTGRIKFNPIPRHFSKGRSNGVYGSFNGPESDIEYYNGMLEDLADTLKEMFLNLLHSCVGKVFVM
jgi:hypothetical protein